MRSKCLSFFIFGIATVLTAVVGINVSIFQSNLAFAETKPFFTPGFTLRTDYQVNNSDDTSFRLPSSNPRASSAMNVNRELTSKKFDIANAKFKATGDVNEDLHYIFVYNLKNAWTVSSNPPSNSVKLLDAVSEFKVDYNILPWLTLETGKFYTNVGGIEGTFKAEDVYLFSLTGNAYDVIGYNYGAMLQADFLKQSMQVMVFSPNDGTYNQTTPGWGLVWLGNLFNDVVNPMFSYHFATTPRQVENGLFGVTPSAKKINEYWAFGVNTNWLDKRLVLDLDYLYNYYRGKSADAKTDKDTSYVFTGYYSYGEKALFRQVVKYEYSKRMNKDSNLFNRNAYTIGLEFFPRMRQENVIKGDNPRFHVVYTSYKDKYKRNEPATASTGEKKDGQKVTTSQFLVGTCISI